jgi:hypothetical protein
LQEKASRKPPPPGAVPAEFERVITVPAGDVLPAVTLHDEPAAAAVLQLMMVLFADQVVLLTLGLTLHIAHVVLAPE